MADGSCCKKLGAIVGLLKAILSRMFFVVHGLICIWRLFVVKQETLYWCMVLTLLLILLEMVVILRAKGGTEWGWFSTSVFLYLAYTLPPIWLLELDLLKHRIEHRHTNGYIRATDTQNVAFLPGKSHHKTQTWIREQTRVRDIMGVIKNKNGTGQDTQPEIRIPISLDPETWVRILQQVLLLLLIIGRWLLPKGKISREQLSQLLLIYIGMAADIIELFEAFKETAVMYSWDLTIVILSLWTASLLQFTFVVGTDKAKQSSPLYVEEAGDNAITSSRDGTHGQRHAWSENASGREGSASSSRRRSCCSASGRCCCCCTADIVSILTSITLQDGPFLVLRMLLIFRYNVLSYTNIFFTSKNTLVILLQVYRLTVLYCERLNKKRDKKKGKAEENNRRGEGVMAIAKKEAARSNETDSGQENAKTGLRQSERKGRRERKSNDCFCCRDKYDFGRDQEDTEEEEEIVIDEEDLFEGLGESDMFEIVTCPSLKESQMCECVSSSPSTELCSLNQVKGQHPGKKRRPIGHRSEEGAYSDPERRQCHRCDRHNCKEEGETQQTFKSNAEFRGEAQRLPMSLHLQQKNISWEMNQKKKGKMKKAEEEEIETGERFMKTHKETLQIDQEVEPVRQLNKNSESSTKSFRKDPKSKRPKLFQVAVEARMQSERCGVDLSDEEGFKPDFKEMAEVRMTGRCPNCSNSENGRQYGHKRRRSPEDFVVCRIKEQMDNNYI